MSRRIGLLTVLLATMAMSAYAQSTKSDVLMRQARSPDRLQKIDLLRAFQNGNISVDADSMRALGTLAGMGTVWRDNSTKNLDFADIRAAALTVLGNSGSDDARTIVLKTIDLETHPMVLVAGFEAMANLGAGEGILATRIMNDAMLRTMARVRHNSVADEYLKTMDAFIDTANPDMQTIEVLTELSQGSGFSFDIRTRANELLKKFW
jgi:hypothetical protein